LRKIQLKITRPVNRGTSSNSGPPLALASSQVGTALDLAASTRPAPGRLDIPLDLIKHRINPFLDFESQASLSQVNKTTHALYGSNNAFVQQRDLRNSSHEFHQRGLRTLAGIGEVDEAPVRAKGLRGLFGMKPSREQVLRELQLRREKQLDLMDELNGGYPGMEEPD
jgi:hypothetical protein